MLNKVESCQIRFIASCTSTNLDRGMEETSSPVKKTAENEKNTLNAWLMRDDPMIIVTHQQVDADAAFSAALLQVMKPNAAVVPSPV